MNASPAEGTLRNRLGGESTPRRPFKARKYRSGHDRLTPAQQDLASKYMPLARTMSKPLKQLYPYWRDEYESAACLALVEAARSFDPTRNIRFSTFARLRIRGALIDVSQSMILPGFEDQPRPPGTVALTPFMEEHGAVLVATQPPPVGDEVDDIDAVEHWLRRLPSRQAAICRLYYVYGKTQTEIAATLGCSQSEVTRLHRKSIAFLAKPPRNSQARNRAAWETFKRPERPFDPAKPPSKAGQAT